MSWFFLFIGSTCYITFPRLHLLRNFRGTFPHLHVLPIFPLFLSLYLYIAPSSSSSFFLPPFLAFICSANPSIFLFFFFSLSVKILTDYSKTICFLFTSSAFSTFGDEQFRIMFPRRRCIWVSPPGQGFAVVFKQTLLFSALWTIPLFTVFAIPFSRLWWKHFLDLQGTIAGSLSFYFRFCNSVRLLSLKMVLKLYLWSFELEKHPQTWSSLKYKNKMNWKREQKKWVIMVLIWIGSWNLVLF